MLASPCPCGSGSAYDACCGPLHRAAREAATAEELMRARYAAYALGDVDYVYRTWHPRTRPAAEDLDRLDQPVGTTWTGLTIHGSGEDWVDFTASYDGGEQRELSRFERRRGRWVYVDGQAS